MVFDLKSHVAAQGESVAPRTMLKKSRKWINLPTCPEVTFHQVFFALALLPLLASIKRKALHGFHYAPSRIS